MRNYLPIYVAPIKGLVSSSYHSISDIVNNFNNFNNFNKPKTSLLL